MSIWINKDTRLVVQGITGREGSFHARQMVEYGTNVVAGVTPGSYTHLRAHETVLDHVCRLPLEKKKNTTPTALLL